MVVILLTILSSKDKQKSVGTQGLREKIHGGGYKNLWKGLIQHRYCNVGITRDILKSNFSKMEGGRKSLGVV